MSRNAPPPPNCDDGCYKVYRDGRWVCIRCGS